MKAIVTGASGMLGSAVLRELLQREEDAGGWSRSITHAGDVALFQHDLLDTDSIRRIWKRTKPELVVHCAALTDADFCEENSHLARTINAYVPEKLALFAGEVGARFVHVSTDAVYNGGRPGLRREEEQPKPASVYAKTKLEGEGRVLAANPGALVIRTTMFGWTLPTAPRPKFAEEILAALTARREIQLWTDAFFSPLHVGDLAEAILALADTAADGVLNVGSQSPVSKYDFGCAIAGMFGLDEGLIGKASVDDIALPARRTKNVGMDTSRLRGVLGKPPLPFAYGIMRLYEEAFDGRAEAIRGRKTYP